MNNIDYKAQKYSMLKRYEVDANYSSVRFGENVAPDTGLGRDCKTREIVKAGCYGRVLSVSFDPISHTFHITIDKDDYSG